MRILKRKREIRALLGGKEGPPQLGSQKKQEKGVCREENEKKSFNLMEKEPLSMLFY